MFGCVLSENIQIGKDQRKLGKKECVFFAPREKWKRKAFQFRVRGLQGQQGQLCEYLDN